MRRSIVSVFGSALFVLCCITIASAQTTSLIGGGLTALPTVTFGPDRLGNGGFETLSGGLPTAWSGGSGWAVDQLVRHSGTYSYRATGDFVAASRTIPLRRGTYRLSGWIKAQGLGSATSGARLTFDLRPHTRAWLSTPLVSGTKDWTRYEVRDFVVTEDATATIRLENYGHSSGTVWFDDIRLEEQLPQPVDVFMLYPNFRGMLFDDGPATMRFNIAVTPPGGDLTRYRVTGTLRDEATGAVLLTQNYAAAADFVAEMTGTLMQHNRPYLAVFSLVDLSNGQKVYSYPAYRVSRLPVGARAQTKITFDERNRVLINGVPRFVLGVYDSGLGYTTDDAVWERVLWSPTGERRMHDMRINFYLNYWYGGAGTPAMNALMTNLQRHGVMYLQTGNCFATSPARADFLINSSDAYVQSLGAHPGSAGYYTIDECVTPLIPGAFTQYNRLRRLDPDSVTFMTNFASPSLGMWRDVADIISTDPYALYGAEPPGGYNHRIVADWTATARTTMHDSRPVMSVLQFFQFTSQGRWPTRYDMRNHAYMAIVEGARGLWWWSLGGRALSTLCSGWCAEKTAHMNDLKAVVNEIADLEPALLADDAPGALPGMSNPAIRTKVKRINGRGYVFAYNTTNAPASATFTWNTAPGTVTVNAENRSLSLSGNSFIDSFGPYQAHVYILGSGGGTAPPTVSFVNPASNATVSGTTTVTMLGAGGSGTGYTYKLTLDGVTVYSGSNATFSWNTTTIANGGHVLTATVKDSSGQSGVSSRSVTVSNGTVVPSPTVSFAAPAVGSTVSGTATVALAASGGSGTGYTYKLAVDGKVIYTGTNKTIAWNTATATNAAHTLTATVTDSKGKTGTAARSVTVSNSAAKAATLAVAYHGKLRDRVGRANTALKPDGVMDATLTVTLSATGGRTITGLRLNSTGLGTWDTNSTSAYWALGVAGTVDGALRNNASSVAVNFPVADTGTFVLFAADASNGQFVPGATLTVRATFSDGTTATATTTVKAPASLSVQYNGKLRDRVGRGNTALSKDGVMDGTLTVTLNAIGGRTITGLKLESTGPGTWDTNGASGSWALAVASTVDGALFNNPSSMAVKFPVANGGRFVLFASDFDNIEFAPGATLTVRATFSDGTTATAKVTRPS